MILRLVPFFIILMIALSGCSTLKGWRDNIVEVVTTTSEERELARQQEKLRQEKLQAQLAEKQRLEEELRTLGERCFNDLKTLPGPRNLDRLEESCKTVSLLPSCHSVEKWPIYHIEKIGTKKRGTRILAFGMVHGDEEASASVVRSWMERLTQIDPRNSWRIVPILNPDGRKRKTRGNANKVDINRNFPTANWNVEAPRHWKKRGHKNRRFPGTSGASEPETKCAVRHLDEFKPDLVVAVHAPYGILDFDGPKLNFPKYSLIPWRRLGHFPGSLGRYMWRDKKVPVLTVELKGSKPIMSMKALDALQDITGVVSLLSDSYFEKNPPDSASNSKFDRKINSD